MAYPEPLEALIAAFEHFPGVGRVTAERLAFHVLRDPEARALAPAIVRAANETERCSLCRNVTEDDPCSICSDPERDGRLMAVVEEPRHVEALERGEGFRVIELNGLTSEATHIYDPRHSLLYAYRVLFRQWSLAFEIARANLAAGARATPLRTLLREMRNYRRLQRAHRNG